MPSDFMRSVRPIIRKSWREGGNDFFLTEPTQNQTK